MVSVASLARLLARTVRAQGRERLFTREMARPDMQAAVDTLRHMVRTTPGVEHAVVATPNPSGAGRSVRAVMGDRALSASLPSRTLTGGEQSTFLHNHPRLRDTVTGATVEVPLSPPDHAVSVGYPGAFDTRGFGRMAQVNSVGPILGPITGSISVPRKRMRRMSNEQIEKLVLDIIRKEGKTRIGDKTNAERANAIDLAARQEAINRALARLGLTRYGARYSNEMTDILRHADPFIADTEDAMVRAFHPTVFGLPYPFRPSHLIGAGAGATGAGIAYAASRPKRERKRERRS